MKPAMNSRDVILTKEFFVDKKDLKNIGNTRINKNRDDTNRGKKKGPFKKNRQKRLRAGIVLFAVKMQ